MCPQRESQQLALTWTKARQSLRSIACIAKRGGYLQLWDLRDHYRIYGEVLARLLDFWLFWTTLFSTSMRTRSRGHYTWV